MKTLAAIIDLTKLAALRLLLIADAVLRVVKPREPAILRREDGDIAPGSRRTLCVFAHFDRDSLIDDYVVYYLAKLEVTGCETIFVSTAEGMDGTQLEKVRPYCRAAIVRENLGHDFASWRTGLAEVDDLLRYDRLIIANDSVYGPIFDLNEAFDEMDRNDADFWGITDSRRYSHHVQSYFVVFGRAVLESREFAGFWRRLPNYRFKHSVILACEVGLSRLLVRAGFRFRTLCPFEKVWRHYLEQRPRPEAWRQFASPTNSTHWSWETLLTKYRCPFLKVQLLRDNPKRVDGIERWRSIVSHVSDYDAALISRHLERFAMRCDREPRMELHS